MPFAAWVKDTFTDHDKLSPGAFICQACQFCASEATPGLAERVGKDKPQKFRNYSHFVSAGVWHPLSKGDKRRMRELLLAAPDVALIAVSGQKHLFFRATPGWWQIEEQAARPFPDVLVATLALVEPLYQAGISKTEIESGRYDQRRILAIGIAPWWTTEQEIAPMRGTMKLQLALFLAQKDDDGSTADR
jgi:hypothetical protein